MKNGSIAAIAFALLSGLGQIAAAGVVTTLTYSPTNPAPQFVRNDVAGNGSVNITSTEPRDGSGSLEFNTSGTGDKATVYGFQVGSALGTLGALVNGGALSYDVFRDLSDPSNAAAPYLFPSFKLYITNAQGQTASLTYEPVYNSGPVASPLAANVWQHLNILNANFYERDNGVTRTNYNLTLAQYAAGAQSDPSSPVFSGSSLITAIEIGVGSGITGNFHSFADNVNIDFNGGLQFDSNFETAAVATPEPATFASAALAAIAGLVWGRSRRKTVVA